MTFNNKNDIKELENWLWEAACVIRGEIEAPKYKDFILPLIFTKRLSDVFEDELLSIDNNINEALKSVEIDHSLVRFYIPEKARWENIKKQNTNLGEYLTDAMRDLARENPKLQGVVDTIDFNQSTSGIRTISDDSLKKLINVLSRKRLGLNDVDPDILGRAYEYLLRKFAEGSGQSAGEFYTPMEVAELMAYIIDPNPGEEIYDPACGTAGLLIKTNIRFKEKYGNDPSIEFLKFYGQEINRSTYAMAKMNVFIHDMEAEIAIGDTMLRPSFTVNDGKSYRLKKFDKVTANPMWNQKFSEEVYENDPFNRFIYGYPPNNSADWGWIQHMYSSLKDNGKLVVVIDTGSVSRGSGSEGTNREKEIRKKFVENDLIESIILLPDNLFYNTPAPGVIITINKRKVNNRKILMINASQMYEKGRPKNFIPEEKIKQIYDIYSNWKEIEGISKIITLEDVKNADYNLSPSRYVLQIEKEELKPIEDILIELKQIEEERMENDKILNDILNQLGYEGYLNGRG